MNQTSFTENQFADANKKGILLQNMTYRGVEFKEGEKVPLFYSPNMKLYAKKDGLFMKLKQCQYVLR